MSNIPRYIRDSRREVMIESPPPGSNVSLLEFAETIDCEPDEILDFFDTIGQPAAFGLQPFMTNAVQLEVLRDRLESLNLIADSGVLSSVDEVTNLLAARRSEVRQLMAAIENEGCDERVRREPIKKPGRSKRDPEDDGRWRRAIAAVHFEKPENGGASIAYLARQMFDMGLIEANSQDAAVRALQREVRAMKDHDKN